VSGRRLGPLVLAGTAALTVGIPASFGRHPTAQFMVAPLVVPPAQGVAVEAIRLKLSGTGRPVVTLQGPPFASAATAMAAVRVVHSGGSTTVTLFVVAVSRDARKTKPATPRFGVNGAADAGVALAQFPTAKPDTIWRLTQRESSAVGLVDTGSTTPARGAAFKRALQQFLGGWDPLEQPALLTAAGVQLRLLDAKHPGGTPMQRAGAKQALVATEQLLGAPTVSVRDDVYAQIDETSGCILGRVSCGAYLFSFSGLRETIVRSDDPGYKLTTHYTGTTCGRTLLGQPWTITTQSGSDPPVTHTVDLAATDEVFTTYATVSGVGSGTAIHKLGLQPGAFPAMQALVDSTGVWSSDAGGQTVPVSVTKIPAGKSC
jgi:hypothetical protein